jgi:MFS family permease
MRTEAEEALFETLARVNHLAKRRFGWARSVVVAGSAPALSALAVDLWRWQHLHGIWIFAGGVWGARLVGGSAAGWLAAIASVPVLYLIGSLPGVDCWFAAGVSLFAVASATTIPGDRFPAPLRADGLRRLFRGPPGYYRLGEHIIEFGKKFGLETLSLRVRLESVVVDRRARLP